MKFLESVSKDSTMAKRGRKSADSLQVVSVGSAVRPEPPCSLTRQEKQLWKKIVASLPADRFQPGDLPLLVNYCRTAARCDELAGRREKSKEAETLFLRSVSILSTLSTKLRLCPSTRIRAESAQLRQSQTTPRPWEVR